MARAFKAFAGVVVATTSSFLAYLLAELVILHAPPLLLAAFTDIELVGLQPQPRFPYFFPPALTRLPPEASPWLYAAQQGSYLPAALLLLFLAAIVAHRVRSQLSLLATQAVVWATLFLAFYSGAFSGGRFRLQRAMEVLWPSFAQSEGRVVFLGGALIGVGLFVAWLCLRRLLDRLATTRLERAAALLEWALVPALLVGALLLAYLYNWRLLWRSGPAIYLLAWIAAPILLAGLPAVLWRARPAPPLELSFRSRVAIVLAAALVLGGLSARSSMASYFARGEMTARSSQHWRLYFDSGALLQAGSLADVSDKRMEAMAARLGIALPDSPLQGCLFASTQSKIRVTGSDEPFTFDTARQEVHHLLTPTGEISDARGDALLLMRQTWGEPASQSVALAMSRYATWQFVGHPLRDYAGRIAREETAYSLRDVFALDVDYLSPLVRDALGGAWVERMVGRHGKAILPVLYRAPLEVGKEAEFAHALGTEWDDLEREWQSYLLGLAAEPSAASDSPREPFFHRGVSFSHEPGGGWGYGSDHAAGELQKIRDLGANSVAIVPYAFTRAPEDVEFNFATDESDARVIRAIEQAQHAGLHVALKPQLWSRGFTGNIAFSDKKTFERWFALYRRWLLHYARMAELYDVDLLVIGTELGGVTSHEAAWRGLIRDIRRIYTGPLTYAAHWDREFEAVSFWDALDYIGVNFYFPLAGPGETPRPDSSRVQAVVAKLGDIASRYRKPIILTEVGYPASATGAAQPWVESGQLDNALQERCYEVVFEAFYEQPWLAGLYWWKWPSHGLGSPAAVTFVPLDKPALAIVRKWYQRAETNAPLP